MKSRLIPVLGVLMIALAVGFGAVTMARGQGWNSMMGGYYPGGIMGSGGPVSGNSISMDKAQQSVQTFVDRTGTRDLHIDELMEFDQNFYALIKEKSTGIGAFELVVNKHSGTVAFESGPDMMWNSKYTVMGSGGMMGGGGPVGAGVSRGAMTVTGDHATRIAQSWLDRYAGGNSAGTADAFYGYYTFHFQKAGQIAGMLSVNGSSGQVWFHTWHGHFIQVRDLGA